MKLHTLTFSLLAAFSLLACGELGEKLGDLTEVTLGGEDGIPPVSGSTKFDVPADFACGKPITDPNGKYTITSSGTDEKCVISMRQEVTALKAEEYANRPELEGARLVKRVDIDVKKLALADDMGNKLEPIDLNGKAFGSTILTKDDLTTPVPFTKSVEGAPIDALKDKVAAKQDIVIPIDIEMTVNLTPMPPAQIGVDFDAQPNIVFGF